MGVNYISAEQFDLMMEDELDALDLDYQYETWKSKNKDIERLIQYEWDNRVSQNGMTYGQINELNAMWEDYSHAQ
jgi:hypothetical protein